MARSRPKSSLHFEGLGPAVGGSWGLDVAPKRKRRDAVTLPVVLVVESRQRPT